MPETVLSLSEKDPYFREKLLKVEDATAVFDKTHSQLLTYIKRQEKRLGELKELAGDLRPVKNGIKVQANYVNDSNVTFDKVTNDKGQVIFIKHAYSSFNGSRLVVYKDIPGGQVVDRIVGDREGIMKAQIYKKHRANKYHKGK